MIFEKKMLLILVLKMHFLGDSEVFGNNHIIRQNWNNHQAEKELILYKKVK